MEDEQKQIDEEQKGGSLTDETKLSSKDPFSKIPRKLSEEELSTPGIVSIYLLNWMS